MSEETANLLSPEELEALSEGVKDGSVSVDTGSLGETVIDGDLFVS